MAIKYDNCKDCHRRCVHAGKDREFICINGVSCKITKEKPNTNADRIRAMSDEELCKLLGEYKFCDICEEGCDSCTYNGDCDKRLLEWLQRPAEGC